MQVLKERVARCDAPIAVIGRNWPLAVYLIGVAYMLYVAVPLIQAPQST